MNRRDYIGSSDIAAVLGISPYCSPVELYLRKRGEADEQSDNPVLRRGRRLEPYVADMYADETGRILMPAVPVIGIEPWMRASPDRYSDSITDGLRVLEIKTANPFTRRDWGDAGTDQVPVYYTAQVQWQLMVTGYAKADLAALIGLDDFRVYTIEADAEIQRSMLERAREFWARVQEGRPPEPHSPEDVAALFPQHEAGAVVEANDVDLSQLAELRGVIQMIKEGEAREAELKTALQMRLGAAEALTLDGIPLATWKTQDRKSVDVKALRAAHPDIAEAFERVGKSRVFRVK